MSAVNGGLCVAGSIEFSHSLYVLFSMLWYLQRLCNMPTAYCSVLFAVMLFEKDEFYVTWNCRSPEKSDSCGQALAFAGIPAGNLTDGGLPRIPAW